jgi:primosomal protein N' (replication factor Y)
MPAMRIVDMRIEAEREGRVQVLSRSLVDAMRDRVERGEQTILFLNRRGFATSLLCPKCGYVAQCDHCSIALTYHKRDQRLCCHICGAVRTVPPRCPNPECRDPAYKFTGLGTQKVEEVVGKLFPRAVVARMDADTMRARHTYDRVLSAFRANKVHILIGTQMIAKGLHFPNVTLVGVIYADLSLHMPDFRAGERTFQLLTQVAGRAGRGDVMGEVLVQTFTPFHPAVQAARRLDYEGFYDQEIEFRRELSYPPVTHLVCLTFSGVRLELVSFTARAFLGALAPRLPPSVMTAGPAPAPIARAKGRHRQQLTLRAASASAIADPLRSVLTEFQWPKEIRCAVDVDALSML